MMVGKAFRDGVGRVNAAPCLLAGVYLATLLVPLPLVLSLRGALRSHLRESLAASTVASAANSDWWQEFSAQASGFTTTFTTTIIGFGAVLDNLSALLDNRATQAAVASAAIAYLVVWAFLVGGILDRYARNRPTRASGFFSASGVFFLRFLRLGALAWLVYFVLFRYVHGWLLGDFYSWATRDMTVERRGFLLRVGLYLIFGVLLVAANLVLDYAKIRAVVEDRRSMLGALRAAARFVARRPRSIGLYLIDGALFLVLLAVYAATAPDAGSTGVSMWSGFLIGQAYILGRLWVKLLFYASETAFFQGSLAHATYTAAVLPVWPESPAAEVMANAPR